MAIKIDINSFLDLDYSKMMFDVLSLDDKADLFKEYPVLKLHPPFLQYQGKDRFSAIKFVFLCYDVQSPLVRIPHYEKRKTIAAELAGLSKAKIEVVVNEEDPKVINMITCFIADVQGNRKFQLLVASERMYQSNLNNLNEPITETDAEKAEKLRKLRFDNIESSKRLIQDIEDLEKEIYPEYSNVRGILKDKIESDFKGGPADRLHLIKAKRQNNLVDEVA